MSSDLDISLSSTSSESCAESEEEVSDEEESERLEGASDGIDISEDPDDRLIIKESDSKQRDDDDDNIEGHFKKKSCLEGRSIVSSCKKIFEIQQGLGVWWVFKGEDWSAYNGANYLWSLW